MANANDDRNRSRRRGGLKRNLASPGESNRRNVLAGRGQVQDQTSPIVSEKALEQPLVKPGGVLKGRSTVRPEPPVTTTGLTAGEMFKLGPRGPQDIIKAGAGIGRATVKPGLVGPPNLSAEDRNIIEIIKKQNPTATPIFEGGKLLGFRGTPPKPEAEVPEKKSFNILSAEGIKNIFERSGEIAERRTTPGALARQRRVRGAAVGRKEKRASLKQLDTSIKDIASTIEKLSLTEGNEETASSLQEQLDNMIRERSGVAAGVGGDRGRPDISTVSGFATQLKELGLSNDEIRAVSQRRFAGGGT